MGVFVKGLSHLSGHSRQEFSGQYARASFPPRGIGREDVSEGWETGRR